MRWFPLVLLIACVPEDKPGQELAAQLSWVETWHESGRTPETVWTDTDGCLPGDRCPAGLFWEETYTIEVAWRSSGRISSTAYVHELLHAHHLNLGISDPNHLLPEWDEVGDINSKLARDGF